MNQRCCINYWRDRTWSASDWTGRDRGYRPATGDYRRSEQFFTASATPRGGFGRDEDRSRDFDPHYHSWRRWAPTGLLNYRLLNLRINDPIG